MKASEITAFAAMLLSLCGPAGAEAVKAQRAQPTAADSVLTLHIDPQPLGDALNAFAQQTGLQVVFFSEVGAGLKSPRLAGAYNVGEALKQLLENTALDYAFIDERTVAIRSRRPVEAKPAAQSSTAPTAPLDKLMMARVQQAGTVARGEARATDKGREAEDDTAESAAEGREMVITGTRLRNTAPTAHLIVITREEIDKRGLATAADVVRALPQNFSSINLATTTTGQGGGDTPVGTLGVASANLRGLGADATLVLVNGRRVSSSPSFDGNGQVNLASIPAAAIERVEVLLDGASAIYGADAIGGVINFVMLKDYQGATTRVRADNGDNGADSWSASQTFGMGWGSGHGLIALEYSEQRSLDAAKAGFTTRNLTSRGGTDWRSSVPQSFSAPGNVTVPGLPNRGALPPTFDGTENWTAADFSLANVERFDAAATRDSSARRSVGGLTLSVEQTLGPRVTGFLEALYSEARNSARIGNVTGIIGVSPINPFNRLGRPAVVRYLFEGHAVYDRSEIERVDVVAGVDISLYRDWNLNVSGTYGAEEARGSRIGLEFSSLGATANVFGNGSAQIDLSPFIFEQDGDFPGAEVRVFDAFADGAVLRLPGGELHLGLGVQIRPEELDLDASPGLSSIHLPIARVLELDNRSYFFEASLPLIGRGNARRGVRGLLLSLAGRYEDYQMEGRFNGPDLPSGTRSFTEFSPRIGLLWNPVEQLSVRTSWGNSFKAPALLELGASLQVFSGFDFPVVDPQTGETVFVPSGLGGNPGLQPETSTTVSAGFDWRTPRLPGLSVAFTYTHIDWTDRIQIISGLDPAVAALLDRLPGLIPRDVPVEVGGDGDPTTIDSVVTRPINVAKRGLEVVDATLGYRFDTTAGAFNTGVTAVWTLRAFDRIFPDSPSIQREGTEVGPDRLVWRGQLGWDRGHYGANLFAHYSSRYRNTGSAMQIAVEDYASFDLTAFYKTDGGLKFSAGARNLTDEAFPFYDSSRASYDPARVDPKGRVLYMEMSKEFSF
jgi:outer membrane receptor protein involved in Fe transport